MRWEKYYTYKIKTIRFCDYTRVFNKEMKNKYNNIEEKKLICLQPNS